MRRGTLCSLFVRKAKDFRITKVLFFQKMEIENLAIVIIANFRRWEKKSKFLRSKKKSDYFEEYSAVQKGFKKLFELYRRAIFLSNRNPQAVIFRLLNFTAGSLSFSQ